MKQTCPRCGKSNETAAECPSCGKSPGRPARRARAYDGYAVGRRVLKLAPAWLLLIVAAFALTLLFFSWMNRHGGGPVDEAFRNEAMNQTPAAPEVAHAANSPLRLAPAATPTPSAEVKDEAASYSVQVGAYVELSQANEQVSRLRAAGFEARVVESGEATRFRFQVRSGLYATREEAARLAADLRARRAAGDTVIIDPSR
ncbi:MAG: SPOR domain-containing protein [Pyrinomonadaceae bacterium]